MPIVFTNKTRTTISFIIIAAILLCPMAAAGKSAVLVPDPFDGLYDRMQSELYSELPDRAPGNPATDDSFRFSSTEQLMDLSGLSIAGPDAVELIMRPDETGYSCNGIKYSSPAPLWIDDTLFLPLRAIAEAFGAEIAYIENAESLAAYAVAATTAAVSVSSEASAAAAVSAAPSMLPPGLEFPLIIGIFMGKVFLFSFDAEQFSLNGHAKELPERIRNIGDVTYIPARALDACLGAKTSYDGVLNTVAILLENDGGIADLSEMIGEILEGAVGNSYFNWRIDIPPKSMLYASSLSSNSILIYCPMLNAMIEVEVRPSSGHTADYFMDNQYEITNEYMILSARKVGSGRSAYIQAILMDYYRLTGISRFYPRAQYDYLITCYVLNDDNGDMYDMRNLFLDNPYIDLLDTFQIMELDPSDNNVRDLSTIKNGKINYTYYLDIPEAKMLLTPWSADMLHEWVLFDEGSYFNNLYAVLGKDFDENLTVTIERMPKQVTVDEFFKNYADIDAARFNSDAYEFLDSSYTKIGGNDILDIKYSLSSGEEVFIFQERLIPFGDILIHARIKAPEETFNKNEGTYENILESLEIRAEDFPYILEYIDKQILIIDMIRISDSDEPVRVDDPEQKMRSMLPGDWLKLDDLLGPVSIGPNEFGFFNIATGARLYATYIKYDSDEVVHTEDGQLFSSIEYAEYLLEGVDDIIDTMDFSEPEPVAYGEYSFAKISYSVEPDIDIIPEIYPGFPHNGNIYILTDENGAYFIFTEIPYVFDSPLNRLSFEMFLENFRAGDKYKESADAASSGQGAPTGSRARRTGAVG